MSLTKCPKEPKRHPRVQSSVPYLFVCELVHGPVCTVRCLLRGKAMETRRYW